MKKKYKIKGLDCANCASNLERKLGKIPGVESVTISFMSERLTLECEEDPIILEKVKKTIHEEEPDVILEEM